MECFSTAELGLQILVVSWTHLFYSKGVFEGDNILQRKTYES